MPIRAICPQGHKILAPDRRAGQRILCPRCRSELKVPPLEGDKQSAETVDGETAKSPDKSSSNEKATEKESKPESSKPKATRSAQVSEARPLDAKGSPPDRSSEQAKSAKTKQPDAKTDAPPPRLKPPPLPSSRRQAATSSAPLRDKTPPPPPAKTNEKPSEATTQAEATKPKPESKPVADKPTTTEKSSTDKTPVAKEVVPQPPPPPPQHRAAETQPVAESSEPAAPPPEPRPSEAEPATEPPVPAIGVRHRPERIRGVMWLAGVLAGLALFSFAPAVMEIYDYILSEGDQPLARWAWFAIGLSGLQLAYAGYLAQLPDWSTVWVAAIAALGTAMTYAMLYAVTLLGESDSTLLSWLQVHATQTGKASGWCFVMLSLNGMFAYFCGRTGAGWRNTEKLRASIGLK